MKALQITATTGPGGLVLRDLPEPRPGPGHALLRVHARSLTYRGLLILAGTHPVPAHPGVIALSDGAGEVVEVGAGATGSPWATG